MFHAAAGPDGARSRIDDAWLAGAEIVRVEFETLDRVLGDVNVDGFALMTPPVSNAP